ncbi:hypothetical protein MST16_08980 [Acinetobacter sp. YH16040_T]|uniref:phage tail tube protein n=1 Tax=unclassified Acinetobacter TaxID=196816 RepID=UPI0015D3D4E7|nr:MULTISPECIES: phage tail tube protein [unclassified Acinetobacter]UUS56261.1 hypothetical protein MST16_08980 [Acinetobacter sp. YH16040_T]
MARIKVQKSQLYYHEEGATAVESVQCAKELELGTDTEEDIDVTCLDDEEDNFDPGKKTPGEGSLSIDLDDENSSHLKLIALSKTTPRKKVTWYLGSSNSDAPPEVAGGAVTLPPSRTWWVWEGYLKLAEKTFVKGQFVGYKFPMKKTSIVNETIRTLPPVGP